MSRPACARPWSRSMTSAIDEEAELAGQERGHGDLVGRVQRRPAGSPPPPQRAVGQVQAREPLVIRAAESRAAPRCARSSGGSAPLQRSGYENAYWMGSRMSVTPSCAMIDPSRNSTIECTTDCGWITTSIWSGPDAEQPVRLDHLEALVHQRGRVDRDLAPHAPGRVAQRVFGPDLLQLGGRVAAERPAGRGQDQPRDLRRGCARAGTGGWRCARCPPAGSATPLRRGRRRSRWPPAITSTSLLASAMVLPASIAASTASSAAVPGRGAEHDVDVGVRGDRQEALGPGQQHGCGRARPKCRARRVEGVRRGHRHHARPVALRPGVASSVALAPAARPTTSRRSGVRLDDRQRAAADRAGRSEDGDPLRARDASSCQQAPGSR